MTSPMKMPVHRAWPRKGAGCPSSHCRSRTGAVTARWLALLLLLHTTRLAGAELAIGASYIGTYRPDGGGEPYDHSTWRRIGGTLSPTTNMDQGIFSPGLASFNDSLATARYAIYYPCRDAFGPDPAQVEYSFEFKAKFYADGAAMPPQLLDREVAAVGFHDEMGSGVRGKRVALGFFLSDQPAPNPGKAVVGFSSEDGRLQRVVSDKDWRDGKIHTYRVQKYRADSEVRLMVWIDGSVVDDSTVYSELPDASGELLGFWFGTSTQGTVNLTVESISFGQPEFELATGPSDDARDIRNGEIIHSAGYADQPYVVVNADGSLTCIITTGPGTEGATGQHVVSTRSTDGGKTWSAPVSLEPSGSPESSWGVPIRAVSGRIYALYTFNESHMRSVINSDGKSYNRVDGLGKFVFRYSDDMGQSWSSQRYVIPIRITEIDRANVYGGDVNGDGKVDDNDPRFFWSPAAAYSDGKTVYLGISKIKNFDPNVGVDETEGWVFCSPNILTEANPENIVWDMKPEGRFGLRSRAGRVCEETSVIKLATGRLAALCRTAEGILLVFYSSDEGRTWTSPEPLKYAASGKPLKNPRAKPCIWQWRLGEYLIWFENIGSKGYENRNPAWLSLAHEKDGRLLCSEPEILLYDRDPKVRISYPDFFELNGKYFLTETQKTVARLHEIPEGLLLNLKAQGTVRNVVQRGLRATWKPDQSRKLRLPAPPDIQTLGFTVEFWVKFNALNPSGVLLDTIGAGGPGMRVALNAGRVEFSLSDGKISRLLRTEIGHLALARWNHIVCVVEPGPRFLLCLINGQLCDGGRETESGWVRYPRSLTQIGNSTAMSVAPKMIRAVGSMRYYDRPLTTSESISNYHAGPP